MLVDLLLSQQHVVFGLRQEATMSKARFHPTLPANWCKFAMKEDLLYSKDTLKIYSSLLRWAKSFYIQLWVGALVEQLWQIIHNQKEVSLITDTGQYLD